jgi:hypothetical protein
LFSSGCAPRDGTSSPYTARRGVLDLTSIQFDTLTDDIIAMEPKNRMPVVSASAKMSEKTNRKSNEAVE